MLQYLGRDHTETVPLGLSSPPEQGQELGVGVDEGQDGEHGRAVEVVDELRLHDPPNQRERRGPRRHPVRQRRRLHTVNNVSE
jgi:hypothetical protein